MSAPGCSGVPTAPRACGASIRLRCVLCALAWPVSSSIGAPAAAATESPAATTAVVVTGTRDPDWKRYRAFLAGMDAFDREHRHAPQADLRFLLTSAAAGVDREGVTLRIATDDRSVSVPIAPDGTFVLPRDAAAAESDADLVLNRRRAQLRWRPSVRSPGVPANARRLGDLRVECAVRWAVEQADVPAFARSLAESFGGACQSALVKVDFFSDRPLREVVLVDGQRREPLPASRIEADGHVFLPPLHDRNWSDDTLVELRGQESDF